MGINKRALKAMFPREKWRIVRGDTVWISAGKDKGQTGTVTKVIRDNKIPKAFVQGRQLVCDLRGAPLLSFGSAVLFVLTWAVL